MNIESFLNYLKEIFSDNKLKINNKELLILLTNT